MVRGDKMPYIRSFGAQKDAKLSTLLHQMQLTAEAQLDSLSITYDYLRSHNMVFILTALRLELDVPYTGQEITIKTYPQNIRGILFLRDFEFFSPDGSMLGKACTEWALMDFAARTLLRPSAAPAEIPREESPVKNCSPARRLTPPPLSEKMQIEVKECHLDQNVHVNNAIYADFVSQAIDFPIRKFEIHYIAEARLGDTVSVYTDGHFVRGMLEDKICFDAVAE